MPRAFSFAVVAGLCAVLLASPAAASGERASRPMGAAQDAPPDVRGLGIEDAQGRIRAWDRTATVQVLPESLPTGMDVATAVVTQSAWANPSASGGERPLIRLSLGARVPDLAGLTRAAATEALTVRGLRLRSDGAPGDDAVVTTQAAPVGGILEFGMVVSATFAEPAGSGGGSGPLLLVTAGGVVAVLVALAMMLRARSRRSTSKPDVPAADEVPVG